jgi:hypothetical protein
MLPLIAGGASSAMNIGLVEEEQMSAVFKYSGIDCTYITLDSIPIEMALIIRPAMTAQYECTTFWMIIPIMAITTTTTMDTLRPTRRPMVPAIIHPMTIPALAVPEPVDCQEDGMTLAEPSVVGGP